MKWHPNLFGDEQVRFWLGSRWEIWAPHPISSLLCFTEKKIEKCNMFKSEGDQIANHDFTGVRSEVWLWASSSISSLPRRRGLSIIEKTPIIELNWLKNFVHFLCTLPRLNKMTRQKARLFCLWYCIVTRWVELMSCKKWIMNYLITINRFDPLWHWSFGDVSTVQITFSGGEDFKSLM